jgi:C4-type Zn-finger protein
MQIDDIKAGNASMKLIIDDPTGNSAIISDKAETRDGE